MSNGIWSACKGMAQQAALRRQMAPQPAVPGVIGTYPEQVNLPFNFALIRNSFELCPPGNEPPGESGVWIILQGGNVVVVQDGQSLSLPEGTVPNTIAPHTKPLFIGYWHGRPLRVFSISTDTPLATPYVVNSFNAGLQQLDADLLTLAGLGKQILHWDQQSGYCSCCGAATKRLKGTWGKKCTACPAEHFPHIHPCAIVMVRRGDQVLLTRKAEWPAGRYSLVAGFVDFGESLEECALREIREETGIVARNIRYVGSQNWPFPSQLMAGFVAEYAGGEIIVDKKELDDARWFQVDALPLLPPPRSIARWIIDNFTS